MRRSGFTLFELLLVIVLITLMVGFLWPNLSGLLEGRRLQESAIALRSLIVMTQSNAMHDGIRYRIEFPGTPDPLDPNAEEDVDTPLETTQPVVQKQSDPLNLPDAYEEIDAYWTEGKFLRDGVRCVAAMKWDRRIFDRLSSNSPIAGPQIAEGTTVFEPLTFEVDGTCESVMFVLTDLAPETEINAGHASRILNVIVDGRTGQTWIQRALLVEEVELIRDHGAEPILHVDFTSPKMITEDNILHISTSSTGSSTGRRER
jgi:type II secretory pathway pseudopilin PulG